MISVIVTIYNVEKYLRRCINSIISQTFRDLEIILVDDGSTDASPQICDEYAAKDSRIKVLHKKNEGSASARNAGIDTATGRFIGFVDGDDFILPEMYKLLYDACMAHGVLLSMCGRIVFDERKGSRERKYCIDTPVLFSAKDAISSLLMDDKCDSASWDKLYGKELFSDIRYPVGVRYDDLNVTARLIDRAGKVCHVGKELYIYVKRSGSITAAPFHKESVMAIEQSELLRKFIDKKYPELYKQSLFFVNSYVSIILYQAYECKNSEMAGYMKEIEEYGRAYLPRIICGSWSVKHKIWFLRNYIVLLFRLWKWYFDKKIMKFKKESKYRK